MKQSCRIRTSLNPARAARLWPVKEPSVGRFSVLLRRTGVLQSIDADALRLISTPGRKRIPVVFQWDRSTQFQEMGKPITPDDLRQGERVNILYIRKDSGLVAQAVLVPNQLTAHSKTTGSAHDHG